MKYNLKDKINGRYFTFGNMQTGEKGPRIGLRVSPELRDLIAGKRDGEWVNLLGFPDDRPQGGGYGGQSSGGYQQQASGGGRQTAPQYDPLADDSIPFAIFLAAGVTGIISILGVSATVAEWVV